MRPLVPAEIRTGPVWSPAYVAYAQAKPAVVARRVSQRKGASLGGAPREVGLDDWSRYPGLGPEGGRREVQEECRGDEEQG